MPQPHSFWMSQACQLAKKGFYTTHPNPRVGCVLVKEDEKIGEGFHLKTGEAHAEINALQSTSIDPAGAIAYVTLEPCSHQGKTGPCAQALIDAKIACVVYGMQDPNPAVSGNGLATLRAAGITVIGPVLEDECAALNKGFIKRMTEGLPFIRLKMAMSLDGRTAMESGESQWITGTDARMDVQRLRAQSDAIVTGIGTVLADNPSMTVRIDSNDNMVDAKTVRQPRRIVLDTALSITPESKILYPANQATIFALEDEIEAEHVTTLSKRGVEISFVDRGEDGRMDLLCIMEQLADEGINEVLVESGSELAGNFLQQGLVDEVVVYMAPKLMGSLARPLFQLPLESMSESVDLIIQSVRQVGQDLRITFVPVYLDEAEEE
ncbi:bifunctional diaminohydroxyphosphoribosylaminopyrimidine deaminase/5-amino-6-(5-phosphoribosylamino)uracil reductase RibD [Marinomonas sp. 2405UD68-3]|uniref:bifunctional diaminohydroxyphosphoribosylaminopyrimidine deaminase/5-amino-6-(5-phosphoribosylamino)uracil reductase RibD n=1 Tax=Marinomonas sp. 2405UD68-3 TaxID=3391835 RepID=UPI0039C958E1